MELLDHIAFVLIFSIGTIYSLFDNPRFIRKLALIETDPGVSRTGIYLKLIAWLWILSAIVFMLWITQDYDYSELGFTLEIKWNLWSAILLLFVPLISFCLSCYKAISDPSQRLIIRNQLKATKTDQLIPRNRKEFYYWLFISLSAASEEIVYRGFMLWYLSAFMNVFLVGVISCLLFALLHTYQGMAGVVLTGITGVVLFWIYISSGSLWLPIILHVMVNIFSGSLGYISLKVLPESKGKNALLDTT